MGNKFNSFGDYGYVETTAFQAKTYEVSISENDKIISVTENGSLLATVKLGLDNQTLSLIGKDGKEFSSVVLPSASVVESARYDEEKQALILTIKLADGTTKEIEISFKDMLDDYAKKEDVEKNTQAIKDEATTRAEADAKFTEKDIEIEKTISTLDDRLTAKDAEIDEALNKKVNLTEFKYEGSTRKAIVLGNHDTILGTTTSGGTVNIAMVSNWDKVDLGSTTVKINLNGSADRPTYNDSKQIALMDDIQGFATEEQLDSKLEAKADASEIADMLTKTEASSTYQLKGDYLTKIPEEYVTNSELEESIKNKVEWSEFELNGDKRKSIVLENHDTILGKTTSDGTVNVAMVSKWDVVDLGTTSLPINLNTPKGVRPTVQEAGQTGEEANKIAYLSDVSALEETINNIKINFGETLKDYARKDHNHDGVYSKVGHTHHEYATKDEVASDLSNKVDWTDISTEDNADRKAIVLKNNDMILGKTTNGGTVNIAMVNKWNIVDLGTTSLPINLNTPKGVRPTVQEAGQSGEEANEIAYLTEIIGLNATDNLLTSKIAVLEEKLEKLSKTAVENVELNGESEATFSGESKDYIISGSETKSTTIVGKTVKLDNLTITNNARTNIISNDVELKGVKLSGDFPRANGNSVININNAEYVVIKDMIFDSSNVYNGIEIGLKTRDDESKEPYILPKSILFENCQFLGKFSNNAILIFGTQANAVININNCYFEDLSNPFRLSNNKNTSCTMNITNCKIDKWDVNSPWQGMMLMQDYTSSDSDKANENNLFAPEKITINVINTIGPNNKKITMPSDISTICGTGDEKQLFYIWDEYRYLVPYDKSKYPTINIM